MDYGKLSREEDFHKWFDYQPQDWQVDKYKGTNGKVIVAGLKILDVYNAFANAHYSFLAAGYDDYGEMCEKNATSKLFTKIHFLLAAVMEYNTCWDLSMQVIWAYMHDDSYNTLVNGDFLAFLKNCSSKALLNKINEEIGNGRSELNAIKAIYKHYKKRNEIEEINRLCNFIKHNGTLYFQGFDDNFDQMYNSVNYNSLKAFKNESYTKDDIENKLLAYNDVFQEYFNKIIKNVMPSDYMIK